jgi:phage repressor protein C with HTH and peptisase S24 domain
MDFNSVFSRLKKLFNVTDDKEIADILGISAQNIYDRKRRNSIPHEAIINVLRDTDVNLEYIFYGLGNKNVTPTLNLSDEKNEIGKVAIRYFSDVNASAGIGCLNGDYCESEVIYVDRNLLPNITSKRIEAIRVSGDSMTPTMNEGDMIFVDKLQHEIKNGKIFIIRMNDELFVKRIFVSPKGYIIKSDNTDYPQFDIKKDDIEILGQVIYTMEYHG